MTYRDYRDIPIEVLRDFALTRSHMVSIRTAADEAGVSHSAFHKFIRGRSNPQPRVLRLLGLWYFAKKDEDPNDMDLVRPFRTALSTLVADMPAHEQDAALSETAEALRGVYKARNAPLPRWLELLSGAK